MKIEQGKIKSVITQIEHGLEKGAVLIGSIFDDGKLKYDLIKVVEVLDKNNVAVRSLYFYERWFWRLKNLWKKIKQSLESRIK